MIYTIAKQQEFIPKWNGNRNLPKKEQGKVIIGFPSVLEIAEHASEFENQALFNFFIYVKSISGFKVEVDGEVRDMTVRDIVELPGLTELFNEIKKEYDKLTVIDKKK